MGRAQTRYSNAQDGVSAFQKENQKLLSKIESLSEEHRTEKEKYALLEEENRCLIQQLRTKRRQFEKAVLDSKRALKSAENSKKAVKDALQRVDMAETDREESYHRMLRAQEEKAKAEQLAQAAAQERDAFLAYKAEVDALASENETIRDDTIKAVRMCEKAELQASEAISEREKALKLRSVAVSERDDALRDRAEAVSTLEDLKEKYGDLEAKMQLAESEKNEALKEKDVLVSDAEILRKQCKDLEAKVQALEREKASISLEKMAAVERFTSVEQLLNKRRLELEEMTRKYNESATKVASLKGEIDAVTTELAISKRSLQESGSLQERYTNEFKAKLERLETEKYALEEHFNTLALSRLHQLLACKIQLNALQEDMKKDGTPLQQRLEALEVSLEEKDNLLVQASSRMSNMREKLKDVVLGQSALEQERQFWMECTVTAEQEMNRILSELEDAQAELGRVSIEEAEKHASQEELNRVREQLASAETKLQEEVAMKDYLRKEIDEAHRRAKVFEDQMLEARGEAQRLQEDVKYWKERVKGITDTTSMKSGKPFGHENPCQRSDAEEQDDGRTSVHLETNQDDPSKIYAEDAAAVESSRDSSFDRNKMHAIESAANETSSGKINSVQTQEAANEFRKKLMDMDEVHAEEVANLKREKERAIHELEHQMALIEDKIRVSSQNAEEKEAEALEARNEVSNAKLQEALEKYRNDTKTKQERITDVEKQLAACKVELDGSVKETADCRSEIALLKDRMASLNDELRAVQRSRDSLKDLNERLVDRLKTR